MAGAKFCAPTICKFVIASLERSDAAQDDATYSISLENDGEVTFDETGLTEEAPTV